MPLEEILEAWHKTKDRSTKVTDRSNDTESICSEMR